ncbi:MAG: SDR family oxidoreductase [Acidimicrobiia bacterium]
MGVEKFRYEGKRVLVVGGASGMGAAIARLVSELGGEVHVADVAEVSLPVDGAWTLDLREPGSIDAVLATIGGPIDALFSCAGVSGSPFSPVDVMLINFVGARHLVERAANELMPAGSAIAFISSIGGLGWEQRIDELVGFLSTPDFATARDWCVEHLDADEEDAVTQAEANYVFSKQAIDVYVQLCAVPFGKQGIRINATAPGPTRTPLMDATPGWQMFGDLLCASAKPASNNKCGLLGVVECPLVANHSSASRHRSRERRRRARV